MNMRMDKERMDERYEIQNESGTCEKTALVDACLDGELSEDEAASLREHLDTCPQCRAYLDDIRVIRASFPTLDDMEVPEGFAERTLDRLPPRISVLRGGRRRELWRRTALPIAASLALILALRGMWLTGGPNSGGEVMSRTLPAAEETVQETETEQQETEERSEAAALETMEDTEDTEAVQETAGGIEEAAPAAGETAAETDAETYTADAGTDTAGATDAAVDTADAGTAENGEHAQAENGADEHEPTTAGNEAQSPASAKNTRNADKPAADSKPSNSGKPSNAGKPSNSGKTSNSGKPSGGGTGKPQTAPPAAAESNVPAAPEPTVPPVEQTAPATGEDTAPAVQEQTAPAAPEQPELSVPQVPDPENPLDGWVPRDWESGGSSPTSGYEDPDTSVSLLGLEDPDEDLERTEGTVETADSGAENKKDGAQNDNDGASDSGASNDSASNDGASEESAVRNTAHRVMYLPQEAAPYMEQYRLSEQAADGTWYQLTGAQFKALVRALEDTGLVDNGKWSAEAAVTADGDTVYVVLRNA